MKRIKKIFSFLFRTHRKKSGTFIFLVLVAYWFCLPNPLFTYPTCMVLEDNEGNLLGARIAADGQWRFPYNELLSDKFIDAVIEFEDRRFFKHPGVDPIGIVRAIEQNFRLGRRVSGASTISMQTIRLSRQGKPRSIFQKIIEIILATRLEIRYSKKEILALYASNAPFGGNVVGLHSASWRYFGKNPDQLSWAEAATLAVLPNSPSLIHPGRNRAALLAKRNRLLDRLFVNGKMDQLTCELAKEEPLPEKPLPLPRLAPHLLDRAYLEHFRGKSKPLSRLRTSIDRSLQQQTTQILQRHQRDLSGNGVHNMAAVIMEVESGQVVAYVGNVIGAGKEHGEAVDVIKAPRSTGSILKPFLYAMAINEGNILPSSILTDIPTQLKGYRPENYHKSYDGIVPARRALARSLNVPFVHLLQNFGLQKFHFGLQKIGLTTITQSPEHYGLTLILGGAEAKLWDLCNAYSGMSRTVNHFYTHNGRYDKNDFRPSSYTYPTSNQKVKKTNLLEEAPVLSASACWSTFDAMQAVERPNSVGEWENFQSGSRIAWKTGTSFGFRDAWAIGVTPRYTVGVWVGNADGEGRPGLVGVQAAGPALFDIFELLDTPDWFEPPMDEMVRVPICQQSGYRALDICEADSLWIAQSGLNAPACTNHQLIHLDASEQWQVNSNCERPDRMVHRPWFVLPPIEEHYYKSKQPNYQMLPSYRTDCKVALGEEQHPMQLIYPKRATKIYVPIDLDGSLSETIFKVAHRKVNAQIYWHLNNEYLGVTEQFHEMALQPAAGKHVLTLVDGDGFRLERKFEILAQKKSPTIGGN